MNATITLERLRAVLKYDAETGNFTWRIALSSRGTVGSIAGTLRQNGYRSITIEGVPYLEHRLAWLWTHGVWPAGEIDHIDGYPANNRITNLRVATRSQNGMNTRLPPANTSGRKGVCFHRGRNRWYAFIRAGGKRHYLGSFLDRDAAYSAYADAAARLHGKFARVA